MASDGKRSDGRSHVWTAAYEECAHLMKVDGSSAACRARADVSEPKTFSSWLSVSLR